MKMSWLNYNIVYYFVLVAVNSSSLIPTPPPPPPLLPSTMPVLSSQFIQPDNQRMALLSSINLFDPKKLKKVEKQ